MKTQKITTTNYFDTINKIGFENLPLVLKQSHTVILTKTVNGEDWSKYKSDADLRRMIDLVFKKVEEFLKSKDKQSAIKKQKGVDGISKTKKYKVELQFIQRFLNLHNTTKTKSELTQFIDELQACMKSKKIQKTSVVADEILHIQSSLLSKINHGGSKIPLRLRDSTITTMQNAIQLIAEQNIEKGFSHEGLDGADNSESIEVKKETTTKNKIMNSADFANMQFNTIGLKDKWSDFIGDPSPGFTAMVYGDAQRWEKAICA